MLPIGQALFQDLSCINLIELPDNLGDQCGYYSHLKGGNLGTERLSISQIHIASKEQSQDLNPDFLTQKNSLLLLKCT